ncbi:MAG: hypothetical protein QOH20_3958, partial [Mycobacterium sp.]|nr:hypothetical protein [Mycobacterium sp.]
RRFSAGFAGTGEIAVVLAERSRVAALAGDCAQAYASATTTRRCTTGSYESVPTG